MKNAYEDVFRRKKRVQEPVVCHCNQFMALNFPDNNNCLIELDTYRGRHT